MSEFIKHGRSEYNSSHARFLALGSLGILFISIAIVFMVTKSPDDSPQVVIAQTAAVETMPVIVPLQSIPAGTALEPAMFRLESRPKAGISPQVLTSFEQITGGFSKTLIIPNQPLHGDYITKVRPVNAITALIPEGYRAVTIHVDVRSAIEGWARAGAKVDVNWASQVHGKPSVTVIVQNAKVISAARIVESENKPRMDGAFPTELTLLVPNDDANKILLAQTSGTLSLSLRGDKESGKGVIGNTITTDDLLGTGRGQMGNAKPENVVRIRDRNGINAEFVMRDGKLVPLSETITSGGNSIVPFS